MHSQFLKVTPEMAKDFLLLNEGNRKVRKSLVRTYADAMRRGEWVPTHQGIAISGNQRLIDGQHRLLAVVESGCAVSMLLTTGCDEDSFKVLDGGLKRTIADQLNIDRKVAEVLKFFVDCMEDSNSSATSLRVEEMNHFIGEHVEELQSYCGATEKTSSSVGVRSAAVLWSILGGRKYAFDMYRNMVLNNVESAPPILMAFFKQKISGNFALISGGIEKSRNIAFVKAFDLFNPANASNSRLVYTDEKRAAAVAKLRSAIKRLEK